MKSGKESFSAAVVCFSRGLATLTPGFRPAVGDVLAPVVAPDFVRAVLGAIEGRPRLALALERAFHVVSGGMVVHLALRTSLIDRELTSALRSGIRQVVILGAGLDTRAYRIAELGPCQLFELDHPATQAAKQNRLRDQSPLCRSLIHLPIDFEARTPLETLRNSGFNASVPTLWICEGVLVYLKASTIAALLEALKELSAPGSLLVATYIQPKAIFVSRGGLLAKDLLRRAGESLGSLFSPHAFSEVLEASGWMVDRDLDSHTWSEEGMSPLAPNRRYGGENLAIASPKEVPS